MSTGVRLSRSFSTFAVALLALSTSADALAATQLYLDGQFRVRARRYENLLSATVDSTSTTGDTSSDATQNSIFYFNQRLRIIPELRVNEYISIFSQIDVLPDLTWGSDPSRVAGFDGYYEPLGQSQGFYGSTTPIQATRAWLEVYSPVGRFKVGRTGMQVGSGIFFNDGNGVDADYGDSADRAQYLASVGPVYLLLGYDRLSEGLAYQSYNGDAFAGAVAYRSELLSASLYAYLQNDRTLFNESATTSSADQLRNQMLVWNLDLWGKASIGPVDLELEAIYRYGQGDVVLESTTEGVDPTLIQGAVINQFGGMARAVYGRGPWRFGLEGGLASGDADDPLGSSVTSSETRNKLTRFTFDRDYHIGLLLFRSVLPPMAADAVPAYKTDLTGDAISNCYYLRPSVEFRVLDNVSARVFGVGAWAMETNSFYNGQKDYGYELDLEVNARLFDRVSLTAQGALLLPGRIYSETSDLAFGGELRAVVEF